MVSFRGGGMHNSIYNRIVIRIKKYCMYIKFFRVSITKYSIKEAIAVLFFAKPSFTKGLSLAKLDD